MAVEASIRLSMMGLAMDRMSWSDFPASSIAFSISANVWHKGLGVTLLLEKERSNSKACYQECSLFVCLNTRGDGSYLLLDFLRRVTR